MLNSYEVLLKTANETIKTLLSIHGISQKNVSDNSQAFTSDDP